MIGGIIIAERPGQILRADRVSALIDKISWVCIRVHARLRFDRATNNKSAPLPSFCPYAGAIKSGHLRRGVMLAMSVYSIVFIIALVCSSTAQELRPDDVPKLPPISGSKIAYRIDHVHPTPIWLTDIMTWLSDNFDLPTITDHPRIKFISSGELAGIRYGNLILEDRSRVTSAHAPVAMAQKSDVDVIAVYNDQTNTMYLSDSWTGSTPAELSIVVHEMVHHLQNLGKVKYECPQAREKQAFKAQNQWLE